MNNIKISEICNNIGYYNTLLSSANESFKYYYGPLLINKNRDNTLFNYEKTPYEKLLHDINELIDFIESDDITYRDFKNYIRDRISKIGLIDNKYANKIRDIYESILSILKQQQLDNSLLEGALINSSPIVTYQGTIRKPDPDKTKNTLRVTIDVLGNIVENGNITTVMENMFLDNIFNIAINSDCYIFENDTSNNQTLSSDVDLLIEDSVVNRENINYPLIYNFLAYLNYNHIPEDFCHIRDHLITYDKAFGDFPFTGLDNMRDLIFKLENLSIKKESERLFATENVNALQFHHDKKMEELYNKTSDDNKDIMERNYNIDILLSYIYTNRQYKYDNYTNYIFTNKFNVIEDLSYITDTNIMICEIDGKYLSAPVIDLADNYKLKLIKLDRDGNISTELI